MLLERYIPLVLHIQGDSGGKVNILGDDSTDHCEIKSSYEHVYNSQCLSKQSRLNVEIQKRCEW